MVCRDLTEDMLPIARHWRREHIGFDALYSGYLASYQQIGLVRETFGLLRGSRTLVMVDPVMGDDGRLYSLYTPEWPRGMADLCACADIIVPNLTEAAILLGRDYRPRLTPEETGRDAAGAFPSRAASGGADRRSFPGGGAWRGLLRRGYRPDGI